MQKVLRSIAALVSCVLIAGVLALPAPAQAYFESGSQDGSGCARSFSDRSFCDRRDAIASLRRMNPHTMEGVRQQEATLAAAYAERAGRQQRFTDFSSGVSVVGALGYLLMGGQAQTVAGYVALAPLVSGNLHANEPTRDLYEAGISGLALITQRYEIIAGGQKALNALGQGSIVCEAGFQAPIPSLADTTASALRAEDLQRYADCRQMIAGYQQIKDMKDALDHPTRDLAALYAADLVAFDQRMLLQDRKLRYGPVKSLTLILSAPLRSLDTLLTGEDTQKALAFLNSAQALSGLNMSLSRVSLANVPKLVALPETAQQPFEADLRLRSLVTWQKLMVERDSHRAKVEHFNRYVALSQEIMDAAAVNQMQFTPDAVEGRIVVQLVPPVPKSVGVKTPVS